MDFRMHGATIKIIENIITEKNGNIKREYNLILKEFFVRPFYYIPQYCKTYNALIKRNHVH
jgi:hypothetical protein